MNIPFGLNVEGILRTFFCVDIILIYQRCPKDEIDLHQIENATPKMEIWLTC